eukprot:TRINITY_DN33940_c1_g1_i1.p2 TRINITY_DN33940_c1_g1~~TRINITY_DN33940_c1_g1_i1.p2  ORF type:complete len:203 (+),score=13.32 TRINITY_DN33940_c1_g1_i1:991-1599(+)
MDDLPAVEVGDAVEDLPRHVGQERLQHRGAGVEGATLHVFQQDLDLSGVIEHAVALDDVGVVGLAEDLDFPADLAPDGIVVVAIDHLEGEDPSRRPVPDHVDGAAASASDPTDSLQIGRERRLLLRAGAWGGGRRRKGEGYRERRITLRERESEIRAAALAIRVHIGVGGGIVVTLFHDSKVTIYHLITRRRLLRKSVQFFL